MVALRSFVQISSLAALLGAIACTHAHSSAPAPSDGHAAGLVGASSKARRSPTSEVAELEGSLPVHFASLAERRQGDVWVYRYAGSYRALPLVLQEEVKEKLSDRFVVAYTLSEGETKTELEVTFARRSGKVVAVARLTGAHRAEASRADYEKMIAKTTFVPDRNNGKLAQKSQTCLVGKSELNCEIAEFSVNVEGSPATLSVTRSAALHRDLAGQVTAVDGTVLYRAELLEMRRGPLTLDGSSTGVAQLGSSDW